MKRIYALILFICLCFAAKAHNPTNPAVKVTLDFESARIITGLMAGKTVTDAQLNQAAETFGSKQLIIKVKGYSGAGEDVFKRTLKELIETGSIKGEDKYNWKLVKSNLAPIQHLIRKIEANQQTFITDITKIISNYTPGGVTADVRACFLVGGGSLGFVNDGYNSFNVALQKVGDDYEGLKYLVAHELYHSIQEAAQNSRKRTKDKSMPYYAQASYGLTYNVWNEGTANLVGDFTKLNNAGPFTKVQLEEIRKNKNRKRQNFFLFETLLYKAFTDTATHNYEQLYNIAFTTGFDETGYFVGYEMAKKIEQYDGATGIADILLKDPLVFFEEYIKLYKEHKDDEAFVRFDAATEAIISKLAVWKDKV
nr:DUF5700 domain-containing putative Zn-dependent protease [uncultured Mucilaginibacter sp.]